jgi:N-acyl-D-amino-acid deacylase
MSSSGQDSPDVAIRNAQVIDGTGRPRYRADIGLTGDKISAIGRVGAAALELDATDRVVSPGFIDVHSHSDLTLIVDPSASSKIRQGVTTEVVGNCGFTVAPVKKEGLAAFKKFWSSSGSEWYGVEPTWETMGEYISALETRGPVLNVSVLAGHGTIRFSVMGDAPRKATDQELVQMEALMEESMTSGACGLSSGLRYTPSCYADERELVRLCNVVQRYDGVYATHMRSEGDNGDWEAAITEAANVAKLARVPLQISHLKALSKNVWNTSDRALALIQRFRDEGVDVSSDQYPYDAAHTGLTVFLPQWVVLTDLPGLPDDKKSEIVANIKRVLDVRGGPERIVIVSSPEGLFDGKDIGEISRSMNLAPEQCIFRLILDYHGELSIISRSMLEEDIRRIMKAEYVMVASDGYSTSPTGPLAIGVAHPRSYGTFPRVIGEYVRERNVITLEDAVRKMTSSPAKKFRLRGRGEIAVGNFADLAVFDPLRVIDRSTFASPTDYPVGIDHVFINGGRVLEDSTPTGTRSGILLRHTSGRAEDSLAERRNVGP